MAADLLKSALEGRVIQGYESFTGELINIINNFSEGRNIVTTWLKLIEEKTQVDCFGAMDSILGAGVSEERKEFNKLRESLLRILPEENPIFGKTIGYAINGISDSLESAIDTGLDELTKTLDDATAGIRDASREIQSQVNNAVGQINNASREIQGKSQLVLKRDERVKKANITVRDLLHIVLDFHSIFS